VLFFNFIEYSKTTRMKNILLTVILLALFVGCKSTEKMLQEGDYESVIEKTIKDIIKGKADNDDKILLDKAYNLANQRDQQQIDFLLLEKKPENYEQVYYLYSSLSARQSKLQQVLPLTINGRQVDYKFVDYNSKIVEAKKNAAKYFYSTGVARMGLRTKEGYREAYYNFEKVKEYRPSDYPDLEKRLNDSRDNGISRVLVEVDSRVPGKVPPDMWSNLNNINTAGLNTNWVEYYLDQHDRNATFDYFITIKIRGIDVTPPDISTREYVRRKRVQDGYEYLLDGRGNVRKDSLGNDIKVPRYKELVCTVIETKQFRSATIRGDVEFASANPNRLLKSEPVAGTSVFEYVSGKAIGDRNALEPEDLKLINMDEVPFPGDFSMIDDCTLILRQAISDLIRNNSNIIY
jgi:hypothetical protein